MIEKIEMENGLQEIKMEKINTENKFRKILLCIPPFPGDDIDRTVLTTGIGSLSEVLKHHNIEHEIFDMRLGYSHNDLFRKISEYNPDLFGITCFTFRHDLVYDIVRKVKKKYPKLFVVIGGPHASTVKSQILRDIPGDVIVRLEGEESLLELVSGKPLDQILGISYRLGKKIFDNPDRPFLDLRKVPFPRYEKFELDRYHGRVPIITSRGCPYMCIYCPVKSTMGRIFRVRDAKSVVEEIRYWVKKGRTEFEILDDNFTLYPDRVVEFCKLIKKMKLKIDISLPNGVRADKVDRPLLKLMRQVGFSQICFGVEAGNNRILARIKKSCTIEKIEEAIKNACELGYDVELFFMVGHPDETPKDVEDSIKLALKYPVSDAKFYNIIPFPETELYDWVVHNKYNLHNLDKSLNKLQHFGESPLYQTPYFTKAQREEMLRKARKAQYTIKKRNFQRKMQKRFGIIGKMAATIFYIPFVNGAIKKFYSTSFGRDVMNKSVRLLHLDVHHL